MSTNESTYILGNGLEGVIAFEKAASENETGSVKIKEITVSSDTVAVDVTETQVKATITVTGVSADIEDGYITRANVTGLNTTKTTEVVLGINKQTALTQTADTTSPKEVTAPSGYYPNNTSLTVKSGSVIVPDINLTGNITFPAMGDWTVTESQVQIPITYTAISTNIDVTLTSGWIIAATAGKVGANATATLTMPARHSWTFDTQTNPPTVRISSGYYPDSFNSQLNATTISISNKTVSVTASATRITTATAGWIRINGTRTTTHTASITKAGWASIESKTATITANVSGDIDLHAIDNNFIASNIIHTANIFGLQGTYDPGQVSTVTLPSKITVPSPIIADTPEDDNIKITGEVTIGATGPVEFSPADKKSTVELAIPGGNQSVEVNKTTTIITLNKYVQDLIVNVPEYTGASVVTPSTTATTIQIQNKMATRNITVAAVPSYTESSITLTTVPHTIPIQNKMATSNITINAMKYTRGCSIVATTTQPSTTLDLTSIFNIADNTRGYMTLNLTTQSKWCDNDTSIQAQLLNAYNDYQLVNEYPSDEHLVEWSLEDLDPSFQPGQTYTMRLYWPIRGRIGVNDLGFTVPVYTGESGMTPVEGGDG